MVTKKALIVYYSTAEKGKVPNEDKIAHEFLRIFTEKKCVVTTLLLAPKKPVPLAKQFKQEKNMELAKTVPLQGFDIVVLGTPLVGSLTSAPLMNLYLRQLPKHALAPTTPHVILYSTGIIPGFAIKKMQSLLSMKGIKPSQSVSFTSMFEFDAKKLLEVRQVLAKIPGFEVGTQER